MSLRRTKSAIISWAGSNAHHAPEIIMLHYTKANFKESTSWIFQNKHFFSDDLIICTICIIYHTCQFPYALCLSWTCFPPGLCVILALLLYLVTEGNLDSLWSLVFFLHAYLLEGFVQQGMYTEHLSPLQKKWTILRENFCLQLCAAT